MSRNTTLYFERGELCLVSIVNSVCVCVCTNLCWSSTAGEEVSIIKAMQRDVEDTGVIVEDLLGAIAMMNILKG